MTVAAHLILHLKFLAPHVRYWQIHDFQAWLGAKGGSGGFFITVGFIIKNHFSLCACVLGDASVLLLVKSKS